MNIKSNKIELGSMYPRMANAVTTGDLGFGFGFLHVTSAFVYKNSDFRNFYGFCCFQKIAISHDLVPRLIVKLRFVSFD